MTTYQWRWQRVDRPGIWAFGGSSRNVSPKIIKVSAYEGHPNNIEQWYCYLGPVPTIAPPEPELRLPEGWDADIHANTDGTWNVWICKPNGEHRGRLNVLRIWSAPDRATAIRAAQKAVEEMEGGSDER